tara:strand:- start:121 stop:480 length:360 start_codon:yes stop_codon:yes gene_type:complete
MIDIIISILLYCVFGLLGIHVFSKIKEINRIFTKQQNIIYLVIFFFIFGMFLAQKNPSLHSSSLVFQITFSIGNLIAVFAGSAIAAFFANKSKFKINKNLYLSLFGSISCGTILLFFAF